MDARHHHLPTYLAAALFIASALAPLAAGAPLGNFCGTSGNYTLNDTYQANIQRLSATLPTNTFSSPKLFATAKLGSAPDIVYALALCRGDTNASACSDCVTAAFQGAQQLCAYNKDATVFYDACLLRYSNQDFIASATGGGGGTVLILMSTRNVTAPFKVVNATADYAAASNSSKRFGTAVEAFRAFVDSKNPSAIHALAQCTPDMSPTECRRCLSGIIQMGPKYFSGKQGGRILGLRCNYRYERYSFSSTPLLQLPEPAVGAPAPAPAPVNGTSPTTGGGGGGRGEFRHLAIHGGNTATVSTPEELLTRTKSIPLAQHKSDGSPEI